MTDARRTIGVLSSSSYAEIQSPSVSKAEFRQALAQLAAGVSIITTCDQDGQKLGMTATAVTSVSLDPPLVLVCVDNRTRTAAALTAPMPFVVHFLSAEQEWLARQFASSSTDKFAGVAYQWTAYGCPQLEDTIASLVCVPYQTLLSGDHTIVVGRVVEVDVADNNLSPLIYVRGQFLSQPGVNV
jgi:flavin reductase (DIM6/NTAB) family NADH-FMN oxidoreductase RutF